MKFANEIFDRLDSGEKPKAIAESYDWQILTTDERETLLGIANDLLNDPKGQNFTRTILQLTLKKDDWDFIRAISLIMRRTDTSIEEKKIGLDYMGKTLEKIRENLSKEPDSLNRYLQYWADYKVLSAKYHEDKGNLDLALNNYSEALDSYQKIGANKKIDEVKRQIEKINLWKENQAYLIPLTALQDERIRLNHEVEEIQNNLNHSSEVLKASGAEVNSLSEQKKNLEYEVEEKNQEITGINVRMDELIGEISKKEIRIRELGTALDFMVALPRLATGPLWVEVVRIAMNQGEIDDLAIQALERLSINGSKEAKRLLSEISARLPEGMNLDHIQFESELNRWFLGIAKANNKREEDPFLAAQTMTETWDSFLQYIESISTHG